jgi:uncharacterized membrane protein
MKKKTIIIFIAIIVLALSVRLYGLSKESFWLDETLSVRQTQIPYKDTIHLLHNDVHTPLYFTFLWGWIRIFGTGEYATRLLSALFGLGAVIALFFFGRKYLSEKAGLIAAAILAVSPLALFYSQEVRPYSLFLLLAILSMHCYLSLIRTMSMRNCSLYILATLGLLYTHLFGALVIIVQTLHFISKRKNIKKFLILQAIILIGILPWIISSTHYTESVRYLKWIGTPTLKSLIGVYGDLAGGAILLVLFIAIIIFGTYKKRKFDHLLLLWLIVPPLVMFLSSQAILPVFHVRYVLFVAPALALLIGQGIINITKRQPVQIGILIIILAISAALAIAHERQLEKDDWRTFSKFIQEQRTHGDILIISPFYQMDPLIYYYDPPCFKSPTLSSCVASRDSIFSLTENATCCSGSSQLTSVAYKNHLGDYMDRTVWLVSVRGGLYDRNNTLHTYISNRKNLTLEKEIGNIEIYKFE